LWLVLRLRKTAAAFSLEVWLGSDITASLPSVPDTHTAFVRDL
jgi:hypothetical protein